LLASARRRFCYAADNARRARHANRLPRLGHAQRKRQFQPATARQSSALPKHLIRIRYRLGNSALTRATRVRDPLAEFWPVKSKLKPTSTCVGLVHMLGSEPTAVVLSSD